MGNEIIENNVAIQDSKAIEYAAPNSVIQGKEMGTVKLVSMLNVVNLVILAEVNYITKADNCSN